MPNYDSSAERALIYDELSRVLTDYECGRCGEQALYEMLVKIQNSWENTITAS